jgi:hypothetical protein
MKRKTQTFYKNLLLGTEFDKYLIEHPEFTEYIPDEALMILLPQDDPDLCKENLRIAKARLQEGQPVAYVKIKKLAPAPRSRIISPKIEYLKAG